MIKKTLLIGISGLLLAVSAWATELTQHVYVEITADSLIETGLLKRLRALKDVEIVAHIEGAEDGFYIVVLPIRNGHDVVGTHLAWFTLMPFRYIATSCPWKLLLVRAPRFSAYAIF